MNRRRAGSYTKSYQNSIQYTSFFNEDSMNDHIKGMQDSLNLEDKIASRPSKSPNNISFGVLKTDLNNEDHSEESFEMDEEQERIDLPFEEDELYSNILMEFLPRLKQEIVTRKVLHRRSIKDDKQSIRQSIK